MSISKIGKSAIAQAIRVVVLGTANAWGPNEIAGTPWPLKGTLSGRGKKVSFRRYRAALLIETSDGKRILIDCGPDFAHQRREFNLGRIDAILITHPHLDHISGLDELNVYRRAELPPIPVYAHSDCWNTIESVYGLEYLARLQVLEKQSLTPYEPIQIGAVTITPFSVEHSKLAPGSVGFLFEDHGTRILYTGDLWALSNPNHPVFRVPLDLLIMECDRWGGFVGPRTGGGHMSFREAVRWLRDGVFSDPKPGQVIFVHFGDDGPNGIRSTYQDWRRAIIAELTRCDLGCIMPDQDALVGYEGLAWQPRPSELAGADSSDEARMPGEAGTR